MNDHFPKHRHNILTKREREVFELLINNHTTNDIATKLFISEKTVRNHVSNVIHSDCEPTGK